MRVKVTVTGTLNLDKADVGLLKKASSGEVMDTMRFQAKGLKATIETSKKPKKEPEITEPEGNVE